MEDLTRERDVVEFSLDVAEVGPIADICCKCTGACKTTRCICRRNGHGCTLGKCKCKPSKCSQLKEQAAVDIAALGTEVHSSDSEPDDYFCVCTDACDTTLCYCLAIKQKECESQCKCNPSLCKNKVLSSLASSSAPSSVPSISTAMAQKIHRARSKGILCNPYKIRDGRNDAVSGIMLSSATEEHCDKSGFFSFLSFEGRPTMVHEESDLLDRICCNNPQKS